MFKTAKRLLSYGIPIIRHGVLDYYYKDGEIFHPLSSNALVSAELTYLDSKKGYKMKLVDKRDDRVVFDYTWKRQDFGINTYIYCPIYNPKKLLQEAMGISSDGN